MTDPIRSTRTSSTQPEALGAAEAGAPSRTPPAAIRTTSHSSRAADDFNHAPARDRRIDRALATGRSATAGEAALQSRIALDARRYNNLGAIVARMEHTPMGPSYEAHRHDVPFAPPVPDAIREMQSHVLGAGPIGHEAITHGGIELLEHASHATHGVAGGLVSGAGVLLSGAMQAHFTTDQLEAGDERIAAARARQTWENNEARVDGHIAQSRADGRDAIRAADVADTSEPSTIDWARFQTDGDYAHAALGEARTQMLATRTRMEGNREQLSNAQQHSPQIQALFPWLVGAPQ